MPRSPKLRRDCDWQATVRALEGGGRSSLTLFEPGPLEWPLGTTVRTQIFYTQGELERQSARRDWNFGSVRRVLQQVRASKQYGCTLRGPVTSHVTSIDQISHKVLRYADTVSLLTHHTLINTFLRSKQPAWKLSSRISNIRKFKGNWRW